MELDHDFTVPVPVDQAWSVLLDVERVALCVPGATLDSADGEEYSGRLKVKVGAMTITYRGTARIVAADESARTVTIEATAKEARGSGTASATVQSRLHSEDGSTRVTVHTKLNVTGRPAQFGRNILSEVGAKLIDRFAKALAEELESSESASGAEPVISPDEGTAGQDEDAAPSVPQQRPASEAESTPEAKPTPLPAAAPVRQRQDDAINLLEIAGPSVAKRALPAGGAVLGLLTLRYLLRRRRAKRR